MRQNPIERYPTSIKVNSPKHADLGTVRTVWENQQDYDRKHPGKTIIRGMGGLPSEATTVICNATNQVDEVANTTVYRDATNTGAISFAEAASFFTNEPTRKLAIVHFESPIPLGMDFLFMPYLSGKDQALGGSNVSFTYLADLTSSAGTIDDFTLTPSVGLQLILDDFDPDTLNWDTYITLTKHPTLYTVHQSQELTAAQETGGGSFVIGPGNRVTLDIESTLTYGNPLWRYNDFGAIYGAVISVPTYTAFNFTTDWSMNAIESSAGIRGDKSFCVYWPHDLGPIEI